ncbi:MAG: hypothetical protein HQL26_00115 [Candidatus Omnitrophica bacterium]|nr:hypothetical protein [Candidatus Omnitrophota bacterium]
MNQFPRALIFSSNKKTLELFHRLLFQRHELILTDSTLQVFDCLEHDAKISMLILDLSTLETIDPIKDDILNIRTKRPGLKIITLIEHRQQTEVAELKTIPLIKPVNETKILQIIKNDL